MNEIFDEHYCIYYVSSEVPKFMEGDPRVKYYHLQLPPSNAKMKLIQRLVMKILHDLGMFYSQQAKDLSDNPERQTIKRELLIKGAKCYELLANETENIIQRYKSDET